MVFLWGAPIRAPRSGSVASVSPFLVSLDASSGLAVDSFVCCSLVSGCCSLSLQTVVGFLVAPSLLALGCFVVLVSGHVAGVGFEPTLSGL